GWREEPRFDELEGLLELAVALQLAPRLITGRAPFGNLIRGEPENEHVLRPNVVANLDIGPVQRAYRKRAAERELHVAGARGFHARGGDLLRQIGRRHDFLRERHI